MERLSRRCFLTGICAGATALSLLGQNQGFCNGSIDPFDRFPEKIPGATEVKKYPVQCAKHCLVHIRQLHYSSHVLNDSRALRKIELHQKEIYKILDYLRERGIADSVYLEGVTPNSYEEFNSLDPEVYYVTAPLSMVLEGKFNPKLEDYEAYIRGWKELEETDEVGVNCLDDREDSILRSVHNNPDYFSLVVFGGLHAWGGKKSCGESYPIMGRKSFRDNIYEWNNANPKDKISLIEVTPNRYPTFKVTDLLSFIRK